jgi:hypothetical protein
MKNTAPLTLPTQEPRRTRFLNIRLLETERREVDQLAEAQGVTASALARHFLLQGVRYHANPMQVGIGANE